jgi:type IV secretory pathway VirB10-like protein
MTGRWITVSLVALAMAGCNKKEADKPPPPTTEAPTAPPTAPVTPPVTAPVPTETVPAAETPAGVPAPPPPGVTPTTTPDAPPTFLPAKPLRPVIRPTPNMAAMARPNLKIAKTPAQLKAERDVLGLWIEQKRNKSILNFTLDGKVTYVEKITEKPLWTGKWKAGSDGVVAFDLAMEGATSSLQFAAYPTAANIMAVAPHWTREWAGSGQYAYVRMK